MKYLYYLYTWGGFYNNVYVQIHKQRPGSFWFNTKVDRQIYIDTLKDIEIKLSANTLAIELSEGYHCMVSTELHRCIEFEGNTYYSTYDLGINYPFDTALYHLQYKWRLGYNDYPLGDTFNYNDFNIKLIKEWITGAFDINF